MVAVKCRWLLLAHEATLQPLAHLRDGDAGQAQECATGILASALRVRSVTILREQLPNTFAPYMEMWRAGGDRLHHVLLEDDDKNPEEE